MKLHKLLVGTISLLSMTILVACQSNSQTTETSTSTVQSSEKESMSSDRRERLLKSFYEELPDTASSDYHNEIEERSQKAWNENQENIFNGQASQDIYSDYLPEGLSKLQVSIEGYDSKTRRLKLTVSNNYDETLKGSTEDSAGNYVAGTNFSLYGYSTLSGRAVRVKILTITLTEDLKAGESRQLEILPKGLLERQTEYAKSLQNTELDSQYLLSTEFGKALWNDAPDLVMGEEIAPHDIALSSLANLYLVPRLVFETYPSDVPDDEELVEILSDYNLSTY
ncbi:hypothetical protein [Streptococcus suis]|uniref:hypothetical protein n=1 Tax=Streptococcus suis TaxID=1307 RepID=UPI0015838959|nr:hypothetical protein [Streptococcus suis]